MGVEREVENGRTYAYAGQGGSVYKGLKDGKHHFIFSQSKLKQLDVCPERGRRVMTGVMPDGVTDSNALGTAIHSGIEACLTDVIEGRGPWALADMIEVARQDFDTEMAMPGARFVKYKTAAPLYVQLATCLTTWYQRVLPGLRPVAVEVNFGPTSVYVDDERLIQVRGQIDYIDEQYMGDWKTGAREWVEWEHKRWDVQPTMYLGAYGLEVAGTIHRPWVWHVLQTNGGYQRIETARTEGDWLWLVDRMVTTAKTIEADLPAWPKNDTHALCSDRWCGAFADCKGQFMPVGWPHHKK